MSQTQHEPNPRLQGIAQIRNLVTNDRAFIDTCSLLDPMYPQIEKKLFPVLKETGKTLIVPIKVIEELKKIKKNSTHERNIQANYAWQSLTRHRGDGLIEYFREERENFADNVFLTVFTKYRMQYKLALITQDRSLASDLLKLNTLESQKGKDVSVYRITRQGRLGINDGGLEKQKSPNINHATEEKLYSLKAQLTNLTDDAIQVKHIPVVGESVHSILVPRDIQLTHLIAAGGEGSVFDTDTPNVVCKIYRRDCLTKFRMEKLRRMVETGFSYDGICWPIDMVENHEGVRIGYLMNKARGVELQKSLFIKPLMEKHFGSWTKVDTVRLALTILNKISKLHCNNIVIGDINPLNILVNSPEEVYFVDTDSYQIEDLPCFVGTVFFTAPELQRKNFRTFLRTLGNERFAVATILFMIMLPGKPPYAQQGGEDPVTNIVNMDFSYPFEAKSNKKTPAGPWRFCWSHLPYTIKKAFYETFSHNGQYSKENDRLSVTQWIDLFTTYLKLLKDGTLTQQDPISIDIFPFRFKSTDKSSFEQCTLCKRQFPVGDLQQGQGYCKGCLRETFKIIKCTNCDKDVIVTYDDMIYFDSNNLPVPKNCSSCHNKIKSGKIMNNRNSKQLDTNYNIKIQSDTVHVECIRCGDDMIVNKKEKRKLHLCVSCKDKKPLKRYDVVFKQ